MDLNVVNPTNVTVQILCTAHCSHPEGSGTVEFSVIQENRYNATAQQSECLLPSLVP